MTNDLAPHDRPLDGEVLRGSWNEGEGLLFLDQERTGAKDWAAAAPQAAGAFHFYLQAKPHRQHGEFNGVRRSAICPAGAVQFVLPDEIVHAAGRGATRCLHIVVPQACFETRWPAQAAATPRLRGKRRAYRTDIGLHHLARMHEAGIDRGLSGEQLFFDDLRQAILARTLELFSASAAGVTGREDLLAPFKAARVVDYIDSHLAGELRLPDLAAVAGLSKFHFSRAFRNTLGLSPHAFVVQRRLVRALELLRRRCPVSEAARLCGFADHAHLTRSFKARFGVSPSALG